MIENHLKNVQQCWNHTARRSKRKKTVNQANCDRNIWHSVLSWTYVGHLRRSRPLVDVYGDRMNKNSSWDEIANVKFLYDDTLHAPASKYSPLLTIQHDAGCRQTRQWRREWAWPRGITVPRFSHAPICCNEVRFEVILPEYHLATDEFLTLTP